MTDGDLIESHTNDLRLARRRSVAQREDLLVRFGKYVAPRTLLDVDHHHIKAFLTCDPSWSPSTIHTYRTHLASFYKWCVDNDFITRNPMSKVPVVNVPTPKPHPIPRAELEMAIGHAGDRIKAMLLLAAYGGLRCCEIAQMQTASFVKVGDATHITIPEQKGGGQGSVPAHDRILGHVDLMPANGWWFPDSEDENFHVCAATLSAQGNRFLHKHGVRSHTMHSLRHAYGTALLLGSGNLRVTQELMRHKSVTSTQIYTDVTDWERVAAIRALAI